MYNRKDWFMKKINAQVSLIPAEKNDMKEIWEMQVEAFSGLLEKYQDFDLSPANESFEKVLQRPRAQFWKQKKSTALSIGALIQSFRKKAIFIFSGKITATCCGICSSKLRMLS